MQSWPVGTCLGIVLNAVFTELFGNGGNDTGIQAAAEQHSIRDVAHQLPLDGCGEGIVDIFYAGRIVFHGGIVKPVALVITPHARFLAPVVMPRQERLVALALSLQCFQLAGNIDFSVAVVSYIKRYDADGIAGNQELVPLLVIEGEGEDARKLFQKMSQRAAIERIRALLLPFLV